MPIGITDCGKTSVVIAPDQPLFSNDSAAASGSFLSSHHQKGVGRELNNFASLRSRASPLAQWQN